MKIVFLGPPGAGKGTQAIEVSKKMGIPHISTGDMLRASIEAGSEIGLAAKSYMDAGKLVPDEVIMGIVRERLRAADAEKGFLLDGFPRTIYQAEQLDGFQKLDAVVNIDVEDAALVKRLTGRRACKACKGNFHTAVIGETDTCPDCGEGLFIRDDDKEDVIRQRLGVYHEQTRPLIDYYASKGLLRTVNGSQGMDAVKADILRELGQ